MTTFYFVLGMVVVLVIAEVIAMVIAIKIINSLNQQVTNFKNELRSIHEEFNNLRRDTDQQFQEVYRQIENNDQNRILWNERTDEHTNQQFQEVYRQIDSRLDKLETRLITSPKQVIKG
jgi:biopolymer transport protein ExbB/TolQ